MKFKSLTLILGVIAAVYGMAYVDLTLRARSAYLEGEKYMAWSRQPELRKQHFEARFNEEKSRLDAEKSSGRMADIEYRQRLKLAQFEFDEALKDSSIKEAYHSFQIAAELFAPPQNRWVRRARDRMEEAKLLWKAELDAAKIPYQDYMLE